MGKGAAGGAHHPGHPPKVRMDAEKSALVGALRRKGFPKWGPSDGYDWNVWWASPATVRGLFQPDTGWRLTDHQLVSHFPNHYELTRKDLMVKNVRRYLKDLRREGAGGRGGWGGGGPEDFVPVTYNLPQDFPLFVEEFRRNPSPWIVEPSSRAQGKGIFIINKVSQVKKWAATQWAGSHGLRPYGPPGGGGGGEGYIVSKYVHNPLLIGRRKFDLRLYVLVTSFRPLRVYMSRLGFARFCGVEYDPASEKIDDAYVHLTNVAVQKHSDDYNSSHGNKWPLNTLRTYLESNFGGARARQLFKDINAIVVHSLKAVQGVMNHDKHCFELYGYDIIIDADLKPWLIEVNASPSLAATTDPDMQLKTSVLTDTLSLIAPQDRVDLSGPAPACLRRCGSMDLLLDESSTRSK